MTAAVDHLSPAVPARRFRLADPSMILWVAMIAILVFLIASPMVRLVVSSFQDPETGRLTWSNYVEAYGRARHLQALWNTLVFGAGVAVLSCLFGVPLAWAISRTDMPAKGFIRLMVFGAFIIPPYLGAIGWILLAGPNAGWLNKVWMALTGAESGIFNIYSMTGLIVVIAVTSFPYVFVFTTRALDLVSSEMEDAAQHPRRRHAAHDVSRHAAAGAARDRRRADHLVSRGDRAVRRARADRAARALPGGLDAALAVLRVPGAGRTVPPPTPCRCCSITIFMFWVQRTPARPARLYDGQRQGRRAAHHPARAAGAG